MIAANITEAKANLSKLLEHVQAGGTVLINKAGKPIAKITVYNPQQQVIEPGLLAGKIQIADDFDQLPPDIADAFGVDE